MKKTNSTRIFNSAAFVIVGCLIVAICIFKFVLGDPSNFMNNDPNNSPLPGNMLGTVYKGGFVVPLILTLLLTVLVLSVERWIAISRANGKKNLTKFVAEIKALLNKGQIKEAQALCEKQKGSVASVIFSSLNKYIEMEQNTELSKEQKLVAIQKELEEATSLEVPTLEQNLPVLATLTTLGTLMGLFGTVLGMIRSFASLSSAGGTDSMALSTGISEALVNTAFGIATGACSLIAYNYYTSRIDKLTFCIDEVGFSIVQSYAATH